MKLKTKIRELFASSAIVRFSKKCYDAMFSGIFGSFFTSYTPCNQLFENGIWGKGRDEKVGSWKDSRLSRIRRSAIVSYENSGILKALSLAKDWLLGSAIRLYGFFFMYFGICALMMNFIKSFAFGEDLSNNGVWFIGLLMIGLSFPMLFSSKTLAGALGESVFFSLVLFKFLEFSEMDLKKYSFKSYGSKRYFWAAMSGAVVGCISYFASPLIIALAMIAVVGAMIVYNAPEVGVLFTVFVAPFLIFLGSPSILLAILILYTFICMCTKIFLGKLTIRLEISDIFVSIFMLILLMGGLISVGGVASMQQAAIYVCFMFIYFMIVSLITTKGKLDRLIGVFVTSGTLTALYGLYQKMSGNMEVGTMDKNLFSGIDGRITATFENSNMLGVFLIMVFPFALSYFFRSKKIYVKLLSLISCGIMGICLIYTWSRGAWLGLILACFIFVLLYSHYIIPILIPTIALGITVLWNRFGGSGIVTNLTDRISSILTMSDSSSVYRLGIWRGALKVAGEYWLTGIGIGSEAFRSVYIRFAESGIETAVHSHNLFLQILIETGAVGLLVFIVALFLCIRSALELVKRSDKDTASEKAACVAGVSALLAALLQGMTDFIWFNYRIFFVFWVVVAIMSAASRIGRKKALSKTEY